MNGQARPPQLTGALLEWQDRGMDARAVAPDGSPVLLYRRLPAADEPAIIDSAIPRHSAILELGAGAGRITRELVKRGHEVVAVDESSEMLTDITGAECVLAKIEGLNLGRRFHVVLLGSHLINTSDDAQRSAFVAACARHAAADGVVLIERHDPDWADTAHEGSQERGGVRLALTDVKRHPPYVSAVMSYEIDGVEFRQPFTARILDDAALAEELRRHGLQLTRHLTRTWIVAEPA
ncbi:MAG: class I SAM-dependent methyltransferase [Chloroflexota bacterium]|nr:class I SAM-dependent methyltransferase [Chloroflexota bacterium]